mgnify:CR=1 FL=1
MTDWVRVHDAIGKRNRDLLKIDELNTEMAKGYVFSGFQTATPTFNPTFKVLRGKKTSVYLHQRIPAWCDRVLWRVRPTAASLATCALELDICKALNSLCALCVRCVPCVNCANVVNVSIRRYLGPRLAFSKPSLTLL